MPHDEPKPIKTAQPLDPITIVACITNQLTVQIDDLYSNHRYGPLPMARAIIVHALRNRTDLSYPEIARLVGHSTHSSTILAHNRLLAGQYDAATTKIASRLGLAGTLTAHEYAMAACDLVAQAQELAHAS